MTLRKSVPSLIKKAVTGCAGSAVRDIRKAAGGLLVETLNDQQGSRLLKMQKMVDIDVKVGPHITLKTTKGVIVCRDLLNSTEVEIATELSP